MGEKCGAKTRSGKPCRKPPIKGRSRCKLHGGKTKIKHGLYSKDVRAGLMDAIEKARSDPRLDHSSEYLARSKAMLDALLQRIADQQVPLDTDVVEAVSRIVNRISSMLLRKKQIEDGIKVRLYTEAREQLVQRLAGVLHKHKGAAGRGGQGATAAAGLLGLALHPGG